MRLATLSFVLLSGFLIAGCGRREAAPPSAPRAATATTTATTAAVPAAVKPAQGIYGSAIVKVPVPELAALGKLMFFDPALSASARQSCASCHAPDHAYA